MPTSEKIDNLINCTMMEQLSIETLKNSLIKQPVVSKWLKVSQEIQCSKTL